jgi:hypothetical protein
MLIMDIIDDYQFTLPPDGKITKPTGRDLFTAEIVSQNGSKLRLQVYTSTSDLPLVLELPYMTSKQVGQLDKIVAQGITTNSHGATIGYLESSILKTGLLRPDYYNEYEIIFIIQKQVIHLHFYVIAGRGTTTGMGGSRTQFAYRDLQAIQTIQNSIWVK